MFPAVVKRGTRKVRLIASPEADDTILNVPTNVFTHKTLPGYRSRETIGVAASGRRPRLSPTSEVLSINTFIMQLPCMTSRENKFWVIFVGPMVLPRLIISYDHCP